MKKLVLSLMALSAITFSLKAQTSGGPDTYGYTWRTDLDPNGPVYNWVEIDGLPNTVEVTTLTDDNVTSAIAFPTPFHYYWYDVSNFRIGSNGYITFSPTTNLASVIGGFPPIPAPGSQGDDYIGGFVTDLIFDPSQGRCYYNFTPNNDSVIVTFDSVPFWDAALSFTGANTFQFIFSYVDSSITVQYKEQTGASAATSGFLSTGIENNSGTIGLQYLFDIYPTALSAVKYYYPAVTTLAINDASTTYNDNTDNGAIFLSKNGGPYTLKTEVSNTGNQPLTTFNVKSEIRSATNILQVTSTTAAGPLNPGQSQLITQANAFTPSAAGAFFFRTDTQLPGDATPSNNRKDVEIQVIDTTLGAITLAYEAANASTTSVSWSGGDGGSAVYMKPSFSPYIINSVSEFITADANGNGYSMMIFDDNGLNGGPGTLLDSVFVAPATFTLNAWTTTQLTTPLVKNSGGFYLLWYMGGDQVAIGSVSTTPLSNRSFEVLVGSGPSSFASYRDRATNELMLRASISKVVSVTELEKGELFGNFYPNPSSSDKVSMTYDLTSSTASEFTVSVYDTKGQLVQNNLVSSPKGTLELNIHDLPSGLYLCKIGSGSMQVERRFTVIK